MTVVVLDQPTTLKLVSMFYKLEDFIADLQETKDDVAQNVDPDIIADDLEDMINISYEMLNAVYTPLQGANTPGLEWVSDEESEEDEDEYEYQPVDIEHAEQLMAGEYEYEYYANMADGDVDMEGYELDNPAYEEEEGDEDYEEGLYAAAESAEWENDEESWEDDEEEDEDDDDDILEKDLLKFIAEKIEAKLVSLTEEEEQLLGNMSMME